MIFVTPAHPLNILDYSTSSIRMERQSQSIQVPESSRRECVHITSPIVAFIHPGSMGQCHNTLLESEVMPWTNRSKQRSTKTRLPHLSTTYMRRASVALALCTVPTIIITTTCRLHRSIAVLFHCMSSHIDALHIYMQSVGKSPSN